MRRRSKAARLRRIYEHLKMDNMRVDNICDPNGLPTLRDGTVVTERTVNQFIRERTKLWRESWVTMPLLEVIDELERLK